MQRRLRQKKDIFSLFYISRLPHRAGVSLFCASSAARSLPWRLRRQHRTGRLTAAKAAPPGLLAWQMRCRHNHFAASLHRAGISMSCASSAARSLPWRLRRQHRTGRLTAAKAASPLQWPLGMATATILCGNVELWASHVSSSATIVINH